MEIKIANRPTEKSILAMDVGDPFILDDELYIKSAAHNLSRVGLDQLAIFNVMQGYTKIVDMHCLGYPCHLNCVATYELPEK